MITVACTHNKEVILVCQANYLVYRWCLVEIDLGPPRENHAQKFWTLVKVNGIFLHSQLWGC